MHCIYSTFGSKHRIRPGSGLLLMLLLALVAIGGCVEMHQKPATTPTALQDARLLPEPAPSVNGATASAISIRSIHTEPDFPRSLTFKLSAESTHPITGIQLLYTLPKIRRPSVTVTVRPNFDPGTTIDLAWTLDTRKAVLPPGAKVNYRWIIQNSAEQSLETQQIQARFNDPNHEWNELVDEPVQLFWYEGDDAFGQALMAAARQALDKLAADADSRLTESVRIYIYDGSDELHDALIYPDEWTGGMAFPEYGIIAIGVEPSRVEWGKRAVTHELSHMVVYQVTYSPLSNVPTWLDEGLAMYAEGTLLGNFRHNLEDAIEADGLFSVRSISGSFPTATEKAALAYAQSYSLVKYLIDNYGSDRMQQLLQLFGAGTGLDDALMMVYGFDSRQLEQDWRQSL